MNRRPSRPATQRHATTATPLELATKALEDICEVYASVGRQDTKAAAMRMYHLAFNARVKLPQAQR